MGDLKEEFDDQIPAQLLNIQTEDAENHIRPFVVGDREPDYPQEINGPDNQFVFVQEDYGEKALIRQTKKKNKKGTKLSKNIHNRSSSAKWKKMGPYLHQQPASIKMLKQN